MKRWPVVVALVLSAPFARDAFADDPPPTVVEAPAEPPRVQPSPVATSSKKPTRWYGWQTLTVDAAATALMVVTVAESREPLQGALSLVWPSRLFEDSPKTNPAITGSLAVYMLGPAFVHALHDRGKESVLSATIRAAAPTLGLVTGAIYGLAGALIAAALDDENRGLDDDSASGVIFIAGMASGYVLGFAVPMLIDAFIFGREPIPADEAPPLTRKDAKVQWTPHVGLSRGGGTVGIGGTF